MEALRRDPSTTSPHGVGTQGDLPLIHDVLVGDRTLFTDALAIERTWELVAPALEGPPDLHPYREGSWGPEAVQQLIAPRRWSLPDE
ncbi:MAG: hypothetical protein WEF28_01395 [Acidimicrobiia bacterium]